MPSLIVRYLTGLNAGHRHSALSDKIIANVLVIEDHEADHRQLWQLQLYVKALVENGVAAIVAHCARLEL